VIETKVINGERCERVRESRGLRVGDVVYMLCDESPAPPGIVRGACGRFHRAIVVRFYALMPLCSGRYVVEDAWVFAPPTPCGGETVSRGAFVVGNVWRVVNPPLASDDAEENRAIDGRRVRKALAR